MKKLILVAGLGFVLTACDQGSSAPQGRWTDKAAPAHTPVTLRWYDQDQVATGGGLYREHCASCHKENAEGTLDFKTRDASGKLPPPPLNGTGHAWHHSLPILKRVVRLGGAPVGGTMPAFKDKLSEEQIEAILAWIQSHWPEEIYALWAERDAASREGLQPIR